MMFAPRIICPCCNGSGDIEPGPPVELTPTQTTIYNVVRTAKSDVPIARLVNAVYSDRIGGGPIAADDVIRSQVYQLNKRLATVGQRIGSKGKGYRLNNC